MNSILLRAIPATLGFFLAAQVALADKLQMECGPSRGHVFNAPEGLVDSGSAGWDEDSISTGLSIFELDLDSGAVSYRWRDARQYWLDAKDEGAEVRLLSLDDTDLSWQVLSIFGDVTEVCSFANVLGDTPKSLCVTSKNAKLIHSARVLVADCKAVLVPATN
ncbi:MAG: hypothetical protein V7651_18390 [Hyphomonas oceanitis]|uniref:hypothetical protein n=1 Tax=Hyphomonas oceanitis TaxID=81033 RepID=UPI0030019E69